MATITAMGIAREIGTKNKRRLGDLKTVIQG
jgi:hypothetical protein